MFCEYQLVWIRKYVSKGKEEVIAHSKYWIPGFKFQTLEFVVRLIWMCCKWATIDPPNIVPTTSSEFSLFPLWPRTNQSSVLSPLNQSEDRIWEPPGPYWLLVRCQQEQEGEGRVLWFRCYPVILCYSRHSRLTFQTLDLLPEFSLWKLMLGATGGTLFKVSQIYFFATSFLLLGALLAYFSFHLIEYLTPIQGKTVLLWNPTCLTNKFSVFDKIRHKMKARITMNVPSQRGIRHLVTYCQQIWDEWEKLHQHGIIKWRVRGLSWCFIIRRAASICQLVLSTFLVRVMSWIWNSEGGSNKQIKVRIIRCSDWSMVCNPGSWLADWDTRRPRGAINSNAERVVILAYDNSSEKEDYSHLLFCPSLSLGWYQESPKTAKLKNPKLASE